MKNEVFGNFYFTGIKFSVEFKMASIIFKIILGLSLGLNTFGIRPDRGTIPIIEEKTCDHVIYSTNIRFGGHIRGATYRMYYNATNWRYLAYSQIDNYLVFVIFKWKEGKFYNYVSFRADPIPTRLEQNHTLYITFRFPDERNQYTMGLANLRHRNGIIRSRLNIGKSRCYPEDGIIGCDPYCVCDTVVQKSCQYGPSILGKCTDLGSVTSNSARYTFNGTCPPGPNRQTDFSPVISSSTSSSSKPFTSTPSSSTTSQAKPSTASQTSETILGITVGGIISFAAVFSLVFYRMKKKGVKSSDPKEETFQNFED